jgi:hypothetical protein
MGSKNEPGKFDCYANAGPDEPMFVLLGRDATAPFVIFAWVAFRMQSGDIEDEKLAEAISCAAKMHDHAKKLGKDDALHDGARALSELLDGDITPDEFGVFFEVARTDPGKIVEALRSSLFEGEG